MAANFTITITGIRTLNVGDLENVIRSVEWTMKGEEEGQTFELPQVTSLGDPEAGSFVQLSAVTPEEVASWIEASETNIPAIKAHIQSVLDKEVAKAALTSTPLPWAPAPEATPPAGEQP